MTKRASAALAIALAIFCSRTPLHAEEEILGLWKTIDDRSGKPISLIFFYRYGESLYGRILAVYDEATGRVVDTTESRLRRADKLPGSPPLCGLDFVYGLRPAGKEWRGSLVDPATGVEYDCRLWREGDRLILRGQVKGIGFLGKNQPLLPGDPSDLPSGYAAPPSASLVPRPPLGD
ncbi:MAG: DUF2147 domain-containing protein [Spirochaetaceae bacterium]|nr:DUF2147 domain-containing protein [Spirochaetaceae bacterium]